MHTGISELRGFLSTDEYPVRECWNGCRISLHPDYIFKIFPEYASLLPGYKKGLTMVLYRRNRVPGGRYFFTVNLHDRRSGMLVEHVDLLRAAFRSVWRSRPFTMEAVVILPEHLHAIWSLPPGDNDFPGRWQAIKSAFTFMLVRRGVVFKRDAGGEYGLWQRRYWEHTIRDDGDYARHVDYIHYNPVKHGLVRRAADWRYSSFHRYVRLGMLAPDWAVDPQKDEKNNFGE